MRGQKENGSYYTPDIIADFVVKRVFDKQHYSLPSKVSVLEPSAGDGTFVKALLGSTAAKAKEITLEIVERESKELDKAIAVAQAHKKKGTKVIPHRQDYLEFESANKNKYDLIVGNPPYIKKNYLSKKQLELCEKLHRKVGLSNNKIKNIWSAFLIGAIESLRDEGVICFVLPAELLQVSYAKELRDYLRKVLHKIEIFAFNELVFEGIDQDVVILIGSKSTKEKGVSFFQANKLTDLKKPDLIPGNTNVDRETLNKWTNYILSQDELAFLDKFKKDLKAIRDYSNVQVGIVTAVNDYFILSKSNAKSLGLTRNCKPILQKSSFVPAALTITNADFDALKEREKPVLLLAIPDKAQTGFNKSVKAYLRKGRDRDLHLGYKCAKRNYWYSVPSIWSSEGVFIKRSNLFPRIMVNNAGVNVTDAFYRITMKKGYDANSLAFSFMNTLSLIFSELEGRFYGGGVLELIPSEFKSIPIPYIQIDKKTFKELDSLLRKKTSIDKILKYTDELILKKGLGLTDDNLKKVNAIYKKLVNRRLKV